MQPATKTIASARLESIDQALIPNLTVTGALLESYVTRQIIPISLSQLTHASGPYVSKTNTGDDIAPFRQRVGL